MKRIIFTLAIITTFINLNAQESGICGMSTEDQALMAELYGHPKNIQANREDWVFIPVMFHLVSEGNGDGRINYGPILKNLARINKDYNGFKMRFYIYGFNELKNSQIYLSPSTSLNAIVANKDPNALNIFITENADTQGGGLGTTLGYYSPQGDYIIVRKQELTSATSTLSHEIGHFFTLKHTFYGWEANPWNEAEHTNHVTLINAPGTNIPVEIMQRTNCSIAADGFCDTPPDYNFGITSNGCNYTYQVYDSNDDLIIPQKNNFMSYFNDCSTYVFTDEQTQAMKNSFYGDQRDFLRREYVPDTAMISSTIQFTNPTAGSTVPTYNAVTIEWNPVDGATDYLLEITGNGKMTTYFSSEPSIFITDLSPNITYIVLLIPFNDGIPNYVTKVTQFKTGTEVSKVNDINFVNDFELYPVPATQGNNVSIQFNSSKYIDSSIKILDILGNIVTSNGFRINAGVNNYLLNTTSLAKGIYFVRIEAENKILTKKLIIQ